MSRPDRMRTRSSSARQPPRAQRVPCHARRDSAKRKVTTTRVTSRPSPLHQDTFYPRFIIRTLTHQYPCSYSTTTTTTTRKSHAIILVAILPPPPHTSHTPLSL
ncbi:hypothetical protein E2C01_072897 [Portunus trituberculatus]|uniref:Uncharacterized protein n=1 Tax=Portunus trituberculatus TaxID=210409 RepID=A0A5B7HZA8_PORTR|nr:hypothetical protein [Portunus trituberculatus]